MSEVPHNQPEQIALAQLSFEPGAFNSELLIILGQDKEGWSSEDNLRLAEALFPRLTNEGGDSFELTSEQRNRLRLIFRPNEANQRAVLRDTFAEVGFELSPDAERTLAVLFSPAQFADFLAKTDNPETRKPFIGKDKKRGAKKNTFTSLIAPPPVPAPKPEQEEDLSLGHGATPPKSTSAAAPNRKAPSPAGRRP